MEDLEGVTPGILLMDSQAVRSAQRVSQLAALGCRVVPVADVLEALQAVRSGHPALVLLQLSMQRDAELELPQMLWQVAGAAYLPIVVLAEQSQEQQRCHLLESGVEEILPDSIGAVELYARIKSLLRMKKLQDELTSSRQALQEALNREHELLKKLQADNDRLTEMVITDPLTRLHNVRYFRTFLESEFKIAKRYGHSLSLLMLDLDHFKLVNDQYGHPAGDYVLKEMGVILRQQVRESDVVARTGGEEFAVILPRADRLQADQFARRIREALAAHAFVWAGKSIKVTCSVGLACHPQDADVTGPEPLVYFADQALLVAKQSGRNCVVHWFEMDKQRKARLRAAFAHDDLPSSPQSDAAVADEAKTAAAGGK